MDTPTEKAEVAWQPLTAPGVAAFAHGSTHRLLLVQFLVALLCASAVSWCLHTAWFPAISAAIRRLPSEGAIRAGQLDWRSGSPQTLAENRFLAVTVDLWHEGEARSPAHVQVELGQRDVRIFSLAGFLSVAYPRGWTLPFSRPELEPWWGAWSPALLAVAALSVIMGLMLVWAGLAGLYCGPAWLLGFFANRELNLRASWRLAGAALMPGALVMSAAALLYGLGVLDLVGLALAFAVHIAIGWVYLLLSPFWLPRHPALPPNPLNPFRAEESRKH
jgi:hypothetical protein